MKITFIIPGKIKSRELKVLAEYYAKLLGKFSKFEFVHLSLDRSLDEKTAQNVALEKFIEKKGTSFFLTLLDERGTTFTSRRLASEIKKIQDGSHTEWIIAVGGAHGYGESLQKKAKLLLSLSELTLPHELACIVMLEQLFRGFSILNNHPYHND